MTFQRPLRTALTLSLVLLAACAGDIFPGSIDRPGDNNSITLPGPGGAHAKFARNGAYYQGVIETSGSDWVYVDLDTQQQVTPSDPASSDAWDIAYRDSDIKLNGGASGAPPSGTPVMIYGDKSAEGTTYSFDAIDGAPPPNSAPYTTDSRTSPLPLVIAGDPSAKIEYAMSTYPQADQSPDTATGAGDHGWYRSSGLPDHVISVRSNVAYVLRSLECRYFKLRMTEYTGAELRFDIQQISGPSCANGDGGVAPLGRALFRVGADSTTVTVDAEDDAAWVYLDLSGAQQVSPTAPANDAASWDIAVRRSDFKLNGGVSGIAGVEIYAGLRETWSARTTAPAGGAYHTDEAEKLAFQTYPPSEAATSAACGGINGDFGWYYYSGFCNDGEGIHHISPRDVVYVVRDRNGKNWKFRVLNYYSEAGISAHPTLEYAALSGF